MSGRQLQGAIFDTLAMGALIAIFVKEIHSTPMLFGAIGLLILTVGLTFAHIKKHGPRKHSIPIFICIALIMIIVVTQIESNVVKSIAALLLITQVNSASMNAE